MPAPDAPEFATLAEWLPALTGGGGTCPDPACATVAVHPEALAAMRALLAVSPDGLLPNGFPAPAWRDIAC